MIEPSPFRFPTRAPMRRSHRLRTRRHSLRVGSGISACRRGGASAMCIRAPMSTTRRRMRHCEAMSDERRRGRRRRLVVPDDTVRTRLPRGVWHRNCVAVGLAAGFVEPLEASALALVEQSAAMIAEQLPRDRQIMEVVARRFNAKMRHHWQRIVEFLKLHYVTSVRDDEYWRHNRSSRRVRRVCATS